MSVDGTHLVCEDKQRLLQTYQSLTVNYAAAVTELLRNVSVLSKKDFDKAFHQMTEVTLQDVAAARLQAHIYNHRC